MAKRYVFWRKPDGKAYRGADGKYSPLSLLNELGKACSVTQKGDVSWPSFAFFRFEAALKFASVVMGPEGDELNEEDSNSIIAASLIDAIKKKGGSQPLTSNEVLKLADVKAAEYFRKPRNHYSLISGLSVTALPFKSIALSGCQIETLSSRKRYPYPERIRRGADLNVKHLLESSRNKPVLVKTSGRTIFEAAHGAFRALNFLCGLWSLYATYGTWSVSFGPRKDPIGIITSGPVYTLHKPDGTLATDIFWHERTSRAINKLFSPKNGWDRIERNRRRAARRINRLPYRKDIEDLIVRYEIALEQVDHDVAFLHMWSILEKITNTIGANYDETISRAIWPYEDRLIAKEILECVRLQRNLYVHAARSSDTPDQAAYLTKAFVDAHLLRLIRNDFCISNLEEYAQYLSLPTNIGALNQERKRIEKALQIVGKKMKA